VDTPRLPPEIDLATFSPRLQYSQGELLGSLVGFRANDFDGTNDAQIVQAIAAVIPHVPFPCLFGAVGRSMEQERFRVGTAACRTVKKTSLASGTHGQGTAS
jgi:hypothetical protein